MNSLKEVFNEIRQATGFNKIDEVVTAFIKSENRLQGLAGYISTISTDTLVLESSN